MSMKNYDSAKHTCEIIQQGEQQKMSALEILIKKVFPPADFRQPALPSVLHVSCT